MKVSPEILRQVKAIELRTRRIVNTLFTGEYRSVFRGQGIEFAEVRAYEQGDDFRSIDWNVSARMGAPYVKTYVEERHLTLLLVVDRSGSVHFGDPISKADVASEVAAVLALAAARHHDRVGALVFADRVEHVVSPAPGRRHALRVIRDVIATRPRTKGTNVGLALRHAARLLRNRSIVVVMSDFRDTQWVDPLRRLAARHEVVAITVDDPREWHLPDAGWVELIDRESERRVLVDTGSEQARSRIAEVAEEGARQRAEQLLAAGADHISLRTDRPYAITLRQAFAKRARRLGR